MNFQMLRQIIAPRKLFLACFDRTHVGFFPRVTAGMTTEVFVSFEFAVA